MHSGNEVTSRAWRQFRARFRDRLAGHRSTHAPRWPRVARFIAIACWLYLGFTVALLIFLRVAGDRWWVATLILFSPRWIYTLPLCVLVPAAFMLRRRSMPVLLIGSIIIIGPIMDLCIPWKRLISTAHPGPRIRVLTCNTHGSALDPDALARLIVQTKPDLVALQETAPIFLVKLFPFEDNWQVVCDGELCLASHQPLRKILDLGDSSRVYGAAVHFEAQTAAGPIQFYDIHLQSPHSAFRAALHAMPGGASQVSRNSASRTHQAADLAKYVQFIGGPAILAGDFNLPADSPAYRQSLDIFSDAFSSAGFGFGWTYRAPWTITRIDHILTNSGWSCSRCWVAESVGSQHQPLIADLQWGGK